jgi:hypothetical protein
MVMLIIVYQAMGLLGWRIVDRKDAELATTIVRTWPNAHELAEKELQHRLDGRAAAIAALEAVLAAGPVNVGWLSALFTSTPPVEAVRRADIGKAVADRISREPISQIAEMLDRLFVLSHHMSETMTISALEQFAKLPAETKKALYNNNGDALIRIARISGSYEQAALQLKATENLISEERLALAAQRSKLEEQRGALAAEFRRLENEMSRYAAARSALGACAATVRRNYR